MRVLVLGAEGMLGHQMVRTLVDAGYHVFVASRRTPDERVREALSGATFLANVDARLNDTVVAAMGAARPEAVVNGIGIVKQRQEAKEALESIRVNSLFPHELGALCQTVGARLLHVSTDCVFSGRGGGYTEADVPDPIDLYGRTKLLGEVSRPGCLTLRTSIIGLELSRSESLVEWFLRQDGPVTGWRRALYSGLTTAEFSRLVRRLLEECPGLDGLWHLSSDPISKYDLLVLLREALGRDIAVNPDDRVTIDRSLDSTRFRNATGYRPPAWEEMIAELAGAIRSRRKSARV